jgi:hypothetical protein
MPYILMSLAELLGIKRRSFEDKGNQINYHPSDRMLKKAALFKSSAFLSCGVICPKFELLNSLRKSLTLGHDRMFSGSWVLMANKRFGFMNSAVVAPI